MKLVDQSELTAKDLVVTDIRISELPSSSSPSSSWKRRSSNIWLERSELSDKFEQAVRAVDVLFGEDAVEPRPQWTLMHRPLQLGPETDIPAARLTVLRGTFEPGRNVRPELRVRKNGEFRVVQISDMHMTTGAAICRDAVDAHGNRLADCEADPLTVEFIKHILKVEKPDLVVLTGDQLHHDLSDSLTAMLKTVAPFVDAGIPYAFVFGNHDSEGRYALSRESRLLQKLYLREVTDGDQELPGGAKQLYTR